MMNEEARAAANGAILGAFAGDAAGATLEFRTGPIHAADVNWAMSMVGRGPHRVAPGQITDDGEMALALMHALVESGTFDVELVARSYLRWFNSPPFDIGGTTARGLSGGRSKGEGEVHRGMWEAAAAANMDSKANGSLMRIAPLGVFGAGMSEEALVKAVEEDGRLTHPNRSCIDACALYCIAIRHLMLHQGEGGEAFERAKEWARRLSNPEVSDWLSDAEAGTDVGYGPQIGFVRIGFTHSFRHLLLGTDYEEAVRETLIGGGDTDTNACIVGGLIGALQGSDAIPSRMREAVLECDVESGRPRPQWLRTSVQLPGLLYELLAEARLQGN